MTNMFLWLGNWKNKLQWETYTMYLSSFLNLWIFVCVNIPVNSLSQLTFLKYFHESLQQRISGLTSFSLGLLKILETQHEPRDLFLFSALVRTIFKMWLLNFSTFPFQNSKFVVFWKKHLIIPFHCKKKASEKNIILHLLLRYECNYQGVCVLLGHSYGCELKC